MLEIVKSLQSDWKFDRPIWKVDHRTGLFIPSFSHVRVRNEYNEVVMLYGDGGIRLRTPEAWKMGFALVKHADLCIMEANDGVLYNGDFAREFVVLTINGAELHLEAKVARQLGTALLRKADFVDRFQTGRKIQ